MIELSNVSKLYQTVGGSNLVLDRVSFTFPSCTNIGILGRNGAGKSTLLRIIAGTEHPDSGVVRRDGSVSWPIGFSGGFNGTLTGEEKRRVLFSARQHFRSEEHTSELQSPSVISYAVFCLDRKSVVRERVSSVV